MIGMYDNHLDHLLPDVQSYADWEIGGYDDEDEFDDPWIDEEFDDRYEPED